MNLEAVPNAPQADPYAWAENPEYADFRIWIFGSSSKLDVRSAAVTGRLADFMERWQSHGAPVAGTYGMVEGRFIVVIQSDQGAQASGCSIDSMKDEVKRLGDGLGTDLLDASRIYFRAANGEVEAVSREEFKRLAQSGAIMPGTEVFDPTLTRLRDLRKGVFAKPVKDSWHLRLYESALRSLA